MKTLDTDKILEILEYEAPFLEELCFGAEVACGTTPGFEDENYTEKAATPDGDGDPNIQ